LPLFHYCAAEALFYKPECLGSIPDNIIAFLNRRNYFGRTMALGSNQPVTEMSTKNFHLGKVWPARKGDNLTAICELTV
jgi:hypothetical protein